MEYTKVQTALNHVKDAIIKKIDAVDASVTSVKNSVTNLPTTLDSKFSALTSKVDGVKTDVASVGGKVDGAKAEIKNSIDTVVSESKVISNDLAIVGNSVKSLQDRFLYVGIDTEDSFSKCNVYVNQLKQTNFKKWETVFDIKGKVVLNGFSLSLVAGSASVGCEYRLKLGNTLLTGKVKGASGSNWSSSGAISIDIMAQTGNPNSDTYIKPSDLSLDVTGKSYGISLSPYRGFLLDGMKLEWYKPLSGDANVVSYDYTLIE